MVLLPEHFEARKSAETKRPIKEKMTTDTNKSDKYKKWLWLSISLAIIVIAVIISVITIVLFQRKHAESVPEQLKIENTINKTTLNVTNEETKNTTQGPKKIVKNGKEYFVMTKEQVKR